MFGLFNQKPQVNHLYPDMKPGDRISKLFQEFLGESLAEQGFSFSKSQNQFKKKVDFFEYYISYSKGKFNNGNNIVNFDICLSVFSDKYRKWEKDTYRLQNNNTNSIYGNRVEYIDNWVKTFYDHMWYDLVKYDNEKVMTSILENLNNAGKKFFDNFKNRDTAINFLKEYPIRHLETITDFYLMDNKMDDAVDFFNENKSWHEEQIKIKDGEFLDNRLKPYKLREEILNIKSL